MNAQEALAASQAARQPENTYNYLETKVRAAIRDAAEEGETSTAVPVPGNTAETVARLVLALVADGYKVSMATDGGDEPQLYLRVVWG